MMDLTKILSNCPKGAKLYSPAFGEIAFDGIELRFGLPILVRKGKARYEFTKEGKYIDAEDSECVLFPGKEQRDWSKFEVPTPHKEFEPFAKVLVRNPSEPWLPTLYAYYGLGRKPHTTVVGTNYNDEDILPYEGNEDKVGKITE